MRNDGDESSAATTVRFYQSTDATITTADTEVGTNALGALSPGATASIGATVSAPATPGTYYYGACVDAVAGESDTTNNCSGSVPVTVSGSPVQTSPDLTVGSPSVNDNSPTTEGAFTLSATGARRRPVPVRGYAGAGRLAPGRIRRCRMAVRGRAQRSQRQTARRL